MRNGGGGKIAFRRGAGARAQEQKKGRKLSKMEDSKDSAGGRRKRKEMKHSTLRKVGKNPQLIENRGGHRGRGAWVNRKKG